MEQLMSDITKDLNAVAPKGPVKSPFPPAMAKYERIRCVGKGSFGEAILIVNKETQLQYICKEVNMANMSPRDKADAVNEISMLAQLQHPNIVQYVESHHKDNVLYIVMEFADGGDLWTFVQERQQQRRPLTESEVLNYFTQICAALKHMHDRKMLHRDLKTGNVFLTKKGAVKLGDFGISKALRHSTALANTVCGTPNYFSPELCQGKPYNNKSDVWALGCILYEMMAGRLAFEGRNMQELYLRVVQSRLVPLPDHYTAELRHLCGRILCQQQAMRPDVNALLRSRVLQTYMQYVKQQQELRRQQADKGPAAVAEKGPTSPPGDTPERGGGDAEQPQVAPREDGDTAAPSIPIPVPESPARGAGDGEGSGAAGASGVHGESEEDFEQQLEDILAGLGEGEGAGEDRPSRPTSVQGGGETFGDEAAPPALRALGRSLSALDQGSLAVDPPAPPVGAGGSGPGVRDSLTASIRALIEDELQVQQIK